MAETVIIDGFIQSGIQHHYGIPYAAYETQDRREVQLLLSASGQQVAQEQPALVGALGRTAMYIAQHGPLTPDTTPAEDLSSLGIRQHPAAQRQAMEQGIKESYIFETTGASHPAIIKQYRKRGGELSFYFMDFVHTALEAARSPDQTLRQLRSPAQYGMVIPASGPETLFMEKAPEQAVLLHESKDHRKADPNAIKESFKRALGFTGIALLSNYLLNDVIPNILIASSEPGTDANDYQAEYWLIDQPPLNSQSSLNRARVGMGMLQLVNMLSGARRSL